jgi:hypothetical protein
MTPTLLSVVVVLLLLLENVLWMDNLINYVIRREVD